MPYDDLEAMITSLEPLLETPSPAAAGQVRDALVTLRAELVPFHPLRNRTETLAVRAFGPPGMLLEAAHKRRWARVMEAAHLRAAGDPTTAQAVFEDLLPTEDPVLEGEVHTALALVLESVGELTASAEHVLRALDATAHLPPGHFARSRAERLLMHRALAWGVPLREEDVAVGEAIHAAMDAINEGQSDALHLWNVALEQVRHTDDGEAIERIERLDRLLKGLFGPLALLDAFETMKARRDAGDDDGSMRAAEAIYHLASDRGATHTTEELGPFLLAAGRL